MCRWFGRLWRKMADGPTRALDMVIPEQGKPIIVGPSADPGSGTVVISGLLPIAKFGVPYTGSLSIVGGVAQITTGLSDLSEIGLTFNGATGAFSGTP